MQTALASFRHVAKLLTAGSAALLMSSALVAQAPANDECTGAVAVFDGLNGPFDSTNATTSVPGFPTACNAGGSGGANDIWFSYVATSAGALQIDTCGSPLDTIIEVFDGSCASLNSLGCNDDSCGLQSVVTITAVLNTTYYIKVGGWNGNTGMFDISIMPPPPPPTPGPDECVNALPIVNGTNGAYENINATTSFAFPTACDAGGTGGGNDVWFSYVATASRLVTIDTCNSPLDTIIEVFDGNCGALNALDCNDDSCFLQSVVSFQAVCGVTYYLRVGGWQGNTGVFSINVTVAPGTGTFSTFAPNACANGRVLTLSGDPNLGGTVTATMTGYDGLPFVGFGFGLPTQPGAPACLCDVLTALPSFVFADNLSLTIPCGASWLGVVIKAQGLDALSVQSPACTVPFNANATDIEQLTIGS